MMYDFDYIISGFNKIYSPEYELVISYDITDIDNYIHWVVLYNNPKKTIWDNKMYSNNKQSVICRGTFAKFEYPKSLQTICDAVDKAIHKDNSITGSTVTTIDTVKALKCPTCSASVKYGQEECEYCNSKLTFYDN